MQYYEMLCVLPGTLSEDEVSPPMEEINKIFAAHTVQNFSLEDMGKSRLAYPVKNIRYGYFRLFRFELEPQALSALEKQIRLVGNLLRVVVRVTDPKATARYSLAQDPTALSSPKGQDREDRPRPMRKQEVREEVKTETATPSPAPVAEVTSAVIEEKEVKEAPKKTKKATKSITIEEIDEKLDEILQKDIDKV